MIEKVNPKHPDKIADRIAGAIVDLGYKLQENFYSTEEQKESKNTHNWKQSPFAKYLYRGFAIIKQISCS